MVFAENDHEQVVHVISPFTITLNLFFDAFFSETVRGHHVSKPVQVTLFNSL